MSLPEVLSELPDGGRMSSPLDWAATIAWLRDKHLDPMGADARRIASATNRAKLYRDLGQDLVWKLIDENFQNSDVKELRQEWVEQAGYNNVTRRCVHELATLYRRAATRKVEDGNGNNLRYQTLQRVLRLNSTMLDVQRLATLHRSVFLMFRVLPWSRLPQIDVVEPQNFRLVTHPLEPTRLIAVIIDQAVDAPWIQPSDRPAYLVWTETERFRLTAAGHMIGDPVPHDFGRIPGLLVAISPPPGHLIDTTTFEDVIRAHISVWFENVLLLKESKSATKVTALFGDLASAMRKQALDSQIALQLPAGVGATPFDMSMDLSMFRDTADHILERAAANHGIPPAVLRGEGASSGYEIELRYVGIRERRIEQEPYFRHVERELAEVMSIVLKKDAPDLAFDPIGWSMNFGEVQMPLSAKEEIEVFEAKRRNNLTDTVEKTQQDDPDLSDDDDAAWDVIARRIENETKRNILMRPLQAVSGSLGMAQPVAGGAPDPNEANATDDEGAA